MSTLTISPSPHVHSGDSVKKNMYGVIFALLPALFASVWFFGLGSIVVILTSVAACLLFEYLIQKFLLKKAELSILDGSAALTGLLLAFNLPSNMPLGIIIIGSFVAIGIGKMSFGGLGNNPFNPALVGRVFLIIAFPVQMTTWPVPGKFPLSYVDVTTGATPLGLLKDGLARGLSMDQIKLPESMDLFIGNMGGSAGEIAALALLLGLAFMLIRKIITWHIPISIIGTVFIFSGILHLTHPELYISPVFHILTGGLMLGAIFMATDYVTSPMSKKGMLVFGVGIGIITVLIRVFGSYPEGVSFAILIMNAFTPLIDKYIKPKRFGEVIKKK